MTCFKGGHKRGQREPQSSFFIFYKESHEGTKFPKVLFNIIAYFYESHIKT